MLLQCQVSECVRAQRERALPHFCINTLAIGTSWTPRNTEPFFSYPRAVSAKPPGSTIPASAIRIGVTEIVLPWVVLGITFMVLHGPTGSPVQKVGRLQLSKIISIAILSPSSSF